MQVVYVKVHDLVEAHYNPRLLTETKAKNLEDSIRKFGLVDPIVVNSNPARKNIIIGGHQRLRVAATLGVEEVPVVYVDLDEAKEKELNLRLNGEYGTFDMDMLANEFDQQLLAEVGISIAREVETVEKDIADEADGIATHVFSVIVECGEYENEAQGIAAKLEADGFQNVKVKRTRKKK